MLPFPFLPPFPPLVPLPLRPAFHSLVTCPILPSEIFRFSASHALSQNIPINDFDFSLLNRLLVSVVVLLPLVLVEQLYLRSVVLQDEVNVHGNVLVGVGLGLGVGPEWHGRTTPILLRDLLTAALAPHLLLCTN